MEFEWDEAKRRSNQKKEGVNFAEGAHLGWESAHESIDARRDYGEPRWKVLGRIGARLYALIMTRRGARMRIISLRKANNKEIDEYEETAWAQHA